MSQAYAIEIAGVWKVFGDKANQAVADIKSLTPKSPAVTIEGNVHHGEILYREHCMECHRFNGNGEFVFQSSPLARQHDWYLREQLNKFKNGQRGYSATDISGKKMVKVMEYPFTQQDLDDIVSYINTLHDRHGK